MILNTGKLKLKNKGEKLKYTVGAEFPIWSRGTTLIYAEKQ